MRELTPKTTPPLAPLIYKESHASQFGGNVEIIEALPAGLLDPTVRPIHVGTGTGIRQEPATVVEIATQSERPTFAWRPSGDRQDSRYFIVGNTELGSPDALQRITSKELRLLGAKTFGPIVAEHFMRDAASLLAIIKDRYGHIEGGIDSMPQCLTAGPTILAALAEPKAFNTLTLAFPANTTGPQSPSFFGRLLREGMAKRRHAPEAENKFGERDRHNFVRTAISQLMTPYFWGDGRALRFSSLSLPLHMLKQHEDAPPITLLAGLDDQLFPIEEYLEHLIASTDVDQIIVVDGSHAIGNRKDIIATMLEQIPIMEAMRASGMPQRNLPLRERIFLPPETPPQRAAKIFELADDVDRRTQRLGVQ